MSTSVIGALRVNLGLDSAQFKRGMTDAQKNVETARKQFIAMSTVAAAAFGAVIVKALQGARAIDETAKAARRVDSSVAGYRALVMAADDAGVSIGSLANDVQSLNRELARDALGDGAAGEALRGIGLAASDFAGLDADQRIALLADRVKELGFDSGQTTALLRDLGIRNREMALLVMQGGDALRNARNDVQQFGLAISDVDAARIEAANDEIAGLADITDYLGDQLALKFVPAMGDLAKSMTDSLREGGGLRRVIDGLVGNLDVFATAMGVAVTALGVNYVAAVIRGRAATAGLSTSIFALRGAVAALLGPMGLLYIAIGTVAAAWIAYRNNTDTAETAMSASERAAAELALELDLLARQDLPNASLATIQLANDNLTLARSAYEAAKAQVELAKAAQQAAFTQSSLEDAFLPGVENPGQAAFEAANRSLNESVQALIAAEDELNARVFEGNTIKNEATELVSGLRDEIAGLTDEVSGGGGGGAAGAVATLDKSLKGTADTVAEVSSEMQGLESNFQSAFTAFVTGAKSAGDAAADLLSSLADMAANAAFKSLIGGMFGGGGGGALGAVAGAIFGGGPVGKAGAKSFSGGGFTGLASRSGGLDGQGGFMAMLHPNETVIDHSKGQGMGMQVSITIDARGAVDGVAEQVNRQLRAQMPEISRTVEAAVISGQIRGRG